MTRMCYLGGEPRIFGYHCASFLLSQPSSSYKIYAANAKSDKVG